MTRSIAIRILLVSVLSFWFVGCMDMIEAGVPRFHEVSLPRIDLSSKGARCEGVFEWNSHDPWFEMRFPETNAPAKDKRIGDHPDWLLVVRLDVFDSDALILSSELGRDQMGYEPSKAFSGVTSVALAKRSDAFNVFRSGHSYKYVLTVLKPEKNLGYSDLYLCWMTGKPHPL